MSSFLRRRRFLAASLVVALFVLVVAVGSGRDALTPAGAATVKTGGTLTIGIGSPVDSFDPDSALTQAAVQVISSVLEPLIQVSADGTKLAPGIATSWSYSPDGLTLTVNLNPNAKFSDGKPVTPADVVFSAGQWKAGPNFGQTYFGYVQSVDSPGPNQVAFHLSHIDYYLPYVMASLYGAPIPDNFDGMTAAQFYKEPIGAGPFAFKSVNANQIVLTKNQYYYVPGTPRLSGVTYKIIEDDNQRVLQLKSGELDIIDQVPPDLASQLSSNEVLDVKRTTFATFMVVNNAAAPFNNVDFRKALSLAINRAAIVAGVWDGKAKPSTRLGSEYVTDSVTPSNGNWPVYNPTQAKKLLAKSGFKSGKPITLLVATTPGIDVVTAQAIAQELGKVGIKVQVRPTDAQTLIGNVSAAKYQMAIEENYSVIPNDGDIMSGFAGSEGYFSGADVSTATSDLNSFISSSTQAGQKAAITNFENWGFTNVPFVPLVVHNNFYGVAQGVHGFHPNVLGTYDLRGVSTSG